jgi:hypothetical protein
MLADGQHREASNSLLSTLPTPLSATPPARLRGPHLPECSPTLAIKVMSAAASTLPSITTTVACPPAPLSFADIHRVRGAPPEATAAIEARAGGASWGAVASTFRSTRIAAAVSDKDIRYAWSAYERACHADGIPPLPISLDSVMAMWFERVIGHGLKSSALHSLTSRILTRAALWGQGVSSELRESISVELGHFCEAFPCQVSSAAPPLGNSDGRLSQVISYVEEKAATGSLFYLQLHALLQLAAAVYPRSSGLLEGHLRLRHILFQPPSPRARGGLVVQLILPKTNKRSVDLRHDSHPVMMGPAVVAVLALLHAHGLLAPDASPDAVVFQEVNPRTNRVTAPALTVRRSTYLLRRYAFIPSGILGGDRLTLRSIRYGASTDAAMAGIPEDTRWATGGWRSASGARTYLDRSIATLSAPYEGGGVLTAPAADAVAGADRT